MISGRYAWPVAALLAVALVPTVVHVYGGPAPLPAGGLAAELPARLEPYGAPAPGPRAASFARRQFGTEDFISRSYPPADGVGELRLFAARAYDGKKLYHFPETALARGIDLGASRLAATEVGGSRVWVRTLEDRGEGERHLARYALFYGRRSVDRPVRLHFAVLPELLVGHREPMTLIFVQGRAPLERRDALARRVEGLLAAACAAFLR
ncbi:MAG: hypothetical protein ACE5JG_00675 [Planctomycetota bacterium]